jgi:hypothetical protein
VIRLLSLPRFNLPEAVSVVCTAVLLCFAKVVLVTPESTASKQFIAAIMVVLKLAASIVSTRRIGAWCEISTTQAGKDEDNSVQAATAATVVYLPRGWQEIAQGCPLFLNAAKVTLVRWMRTPYDAGVAMAYITEILTVQAHMCKVSRSRQAAAPSMLLDTEPEQACHAATPPRQTLPRSTLRLSVARAGLHNVAILHEVFKCFIVVKLGYTVGIFFMLVCLQVVHGALSGPECEYKLFGVRSSVLVKVELVEQLVGRKEYLLVFVHAVFEPESGKPT